MIEATGAQALGRGLKAGDEVYAAAAPQAALTAWQLLFDVAGLKAGQKVLIHAGAGGILVSIVEPPPADLAAQHDAHTLSEGMHTRGKIVMKVA